MAQKKITDLPLIGALVSTLSIPSDNATATYRFTIAQLITYLRTAFNVVTTISAAGTALTGAEFIVFLDPTAASFVQALPAVAGINDGTRLTFKNIATNANTATLDPNGTELVEGQLTLVLSSLDNVTIVKQGTAWYIV